MSSNLRICGCQEAGGRLAAIRWKRLLAGNQTPAGIVITKEADPRLSRSARARSRYRKGKRKGAKVCAKDGNSADEERDVDAVGGNAAGLSRVLSRDRPRFLDLALASPTVQQSQAGHFATPILHHRSTPSCRAFPPYKLIFFLLFTCTALS